MFNVASSILRKGRVLLYRGEKSLKSRRGAAMLVNMVIVGMMMGLMATSFSQLASGQFSNMAAYRTAVQAYQVAEAKANEIGVTSYTSLASAARAVVAGATTWQREVIVGAEVDLGGGNRQRPVTINVYSGAETAPRASIVKYPTSAGTAAGVPSGVIAVWRGSAATIPAGWVLCNGANGTPDLRSRFIYGAGGDVDTKLTYGTSWNAVNGHFAVGQTGGEEQHIQTIAEMASHGHTAWTDGQGSHAHAGSAATAGGTHNHAVPVAQQVGQAQSFTWNGARSIAAPVLNTGSTITVSYDEYTFTYTPTTLATTDGTSSHTHPVTLVTDGLHGHNVGIGASGSSGGSNVLPRFITLCYIMKT